MDGMDLFERCEICLQTYQRDRCEGGVFTGLLDGEWVEDVYVCDSCSKRHEMVEEGDES